MVNISSCCQGKWVHDDCCPNARPMTSPTPPTNNPGQAPDRDVGELVARLRLPEGGPNWLGRWSRERREAADALERTSSALVEAEKRIEQLDQIVYIPGVFRCAKCELRLVSSTLNAGDGSVRANKEPQQCPNNCGPMWRITEREAGNKLADDLDTACDKLIAAEARVRVLEGALEQVLAAHGDHQIALATLKHEATNRASDPISRAQSAAALNARSALSTPPDRQEKEEGK